MNDYRFKVKTPLLKLKSVHSFEKLFLHSWWVILFVLLCYMFYEQGQKKRSEDYISLSNQLKELNHEKEKAVALQKKLLLQINSQSDPAWIELSLMKGLGLVPEGKEKVYFTDNQSGVPAIISPQRTRRMSQRDTENLSVSLCDILRVLCGDFFTKKKNNTCTQINGT